MSVRTLTGGAQVIPVPRPGARARRGLPGAWLSRSLATLACLVGLSAPMTAQWRALSRAPVGLFAYDRAAPLGYEEEPSTTPHPDLMQVRISFASPAGGRVTGFLSRPVAAAPGRMPGVVLLHGAPGTAAAAMNTQGRDLARQGMVVIGIDAPWVRRGGLPDLTPRDSAEQVQLMQDLQRAIDVLLSRADVDPDRIGYVGGSYGGAMGGLFVALDRRLRAAVLHVADGGLVSHFLDMRGEPAGPLLELSPADRERWLRAMWPIEPIRFIGEGTGTSLLFQNGRQDQLVSRHAAEALHAAAPPTRTVHWYDAGHRLNLGAQQARVQWLVDRLRHGG